MVQSLYSKPTSLPSVASTSVSSQPAGPDVFPLLDLPTEVIIGILSFGDVNTLICASETCKLLNEIIRNTTLFQWRLALKASNQAESTICPPTNLPEQLRQLTQREIGWMHFDFEAKTSLDVSSPSSIYELQHGVFAQGVAGPPDLHSPHSSSGIRIIHLPQSSKTQLTPQDVSPEITATSSQGNDVGKSREECPFQLDSYSLGFGFHDFNLDPSQDLAVYVSAHPAEGLEDWMYIVLRIRRISQKGGLHPNASKAEINLGLRQGWTTGYTIHIFGDFVGLLVREWRHPQLAHDATLFIYNWKTGIRQVKISKPNLDSFIFLSTNYFLLVQHQEPFGISIYHFQPRKSSVADRSRIVAPSAPKHVATYLLPDPAHNAQELTLIQCRCEPTPVWEEPVYVEAELEDEGQVCVSNDNGRGHEEEEEVEEESRGESGETPSSSPEFVLDERTGGYHRTKSSTADANIPSGWNKDHNSTGSNLTRPPANQSQGQTTVPPLFPHQQPIRPGVNDFRVAVISFELVVDGRKETLIGFIDISALFKHARDHYESQMRIQSQSQSPSTLPYTLHRPAVSEQSAGPPDPSSDSSPNPTTPTDTDTLANEDSTNEDDDKSSPPTPTPIPPPTHVSHPTILPWSTWGPPNTRFYDAELPRSWVCFIYNNRFVFGTRHPPVGRLSLSDYDPDAMDVDDEWRGGEEEEDVTYINLLDFNRGTLSDSHPATVGGVGRLGMGVREGLGGKGAARPWLEAFPEYKKQLVTLYPHEKDGKEDWTGKKMPLTVGVDLEEYLAEHESDSEELSPEAIKDYTLTELRFPQRGAAYFHSTTNNPSTPVGEFLAEGPITTNLPFRQISYQRPCKGYKSLMVDGERILLLEADEDENARTLEVLTF